MAKSQRTLQEQLGEGFPVARERYEAEKPRYQKNNKPPKKEHPDAENWNYFHDLPRTPNPSDDGRTHININTKAQTDLGGVLAPMTPLAFRHPVIGNCVSISAAMDFLSHGARDARLLTLPRGARRNIIGDTPLMDYKHRDYILMDLMWTRIKAYPQLAEEVKESYLPFDSYTLEGEMGYGQRNRFSRIVIQGMEIIRQALKDGVEPDFRCYMSDEETDPSQAYAQFRHEVPAPRTSPSSNKLLRDLLSPPVKAGTKKKSGKVKMSTEPEHQAVSHLNFVFEEAPEDVKGAQVVCQNMVTWAKHHIGGYLADPEKQSLPLDALISECLEPAIEQVTKVLKLRRLTDAEFKRYVGEYLHLRMTQSLEKTVEVSCKISKATVFQPKGDYYTTVKVSPPEIVQTESTNLNGLIEHLTDHFLRVEDPVYRTRDDIVATILAYYQQNGFPKAQVQWLRNYNSQGPGVVCVVTNTESIGYVKGVSLNDPAMMISDPVETAVPETGSAEPTSIEMEEQAIEVLGKNIIILGVNQVEDQPLQLQEASAIQENLRHHLEANGYHWELFLRWIGDSCVRDSSDQLRLGICDDEMVELDDQDQHVAVVRLIKMGDTHHVGWSLQTVDDYRSNKGDVLQSDVVWYQIDSEKICLYQASENDLSNDPVAEEEKNATN